MARSSTAPAGRSGGRQRADQRAKVQALLDDLAGQVEQLRTRPGWLAMLRGTVRLHRYSMNNQLLIASQAAKRGFTASHVAGFRAWKDAGRAVRKGDQGLAILAPTPRLVPIKDDERVDDADVVQTRRGPCKRVMGYRVTYVWDVSQTDGTTGTDQTSPPGVNAEHSAEPDQATLERVRGDLEARVRAAGYTVTYADPGSGRLGSTQPRTREVTIAPSGNPREIVTTLTHELAHIQLGHTETGYDYRAHRGAAEVQAESVAFVLLGAHGIDAGDDSVSYVAGWAGDTDDAVRTAAGAVTSAAHALLTDPEAGTDDDARVSPEAPVAAADPSEPKQPTPHADPVADPALPSGEALTIGDARTTLYALESAARDGQTRVDTLAASLRAADLDAATLGEVTNVLDAADAMTAAAARARGGLNARHQQLEEAVNATPHAAKASFYRHGGVQQGRAT